MNVCFRKEVMQDTVRLVWDIEGDVQLDMFALKMTARNPIDALLPMQLSQYDERQFLQYDISGKISLAERLGRVLNKSEALRLFRQLLRAWDEVDSYMLAESSLYLDMNYVFLDTEDRVSFLYLPLEAESTVDKIEFFRFLAEQIREDETERENYIYDIRNAFNRGAVKRTADLKDLLKKYEAAVVSKEAVTAKTADVTAGGGEVQESKMPANAILSAVMEREQSAFAPVGKEGVSFSLPGKEGLSFSIPGKEKAAETAQKAEKKEKKSFFSKSEKIGGPLNIPGKAKPESAPVPEKTEKKAEKHLFSRPSKNKVPSNVPGNFEIPSIPVPEAEEKTFASAPVRSGAPLNIPGKAPAAAAVEAQKKPSFGMPVRSGAPLNIPGKAPAAPALEAEKKQGGFSFFGKKAAPKEAEQYPDAESLRLEEEQRIREKKNEDMYESYEQTVLMDTEPQREPEEEKTMFLQPQVMISARLFRQRTGEEAIIQKTDWKLGSGSSVDYRIEGNKTISRNHGVFTFQDGRAYYTDNHSSNGSYIDGKRAEAGVPVEVKNNSILKLSDEEFVFRM